ncbi:MAG: bifunctional hydroxymethylpyrimidine kinase/phosphomethylpyrimidine kinase, partial [Methyloceanibacter sp.]
KRLLAIGADAVLLTGGESMAETALDIFASEAGVKRIEAPRHATQNTHGTGCTLSSAIAAELAKGEPLEKAIKLAKMYVTAAIIAADEIAVGQGAGPLHHFHALWPQPDRRSR